MAKAKRDERDEALRNLIIETEIASSRVYIALERAKRTERMLSNGSKKAIDRLDESHTKIRKALELLYSERSSGVE